MSSPWLFHSQKNLTRPIQRAVTPKWKNPMMVTGNRVGALTTGSDDFHEPLVGKESVWNCIPWSFGGIEEGKKVRWYPGYDKPCLKLQTIGCLRRWNSDGRRVWTIFSTSNGSMVHLSGNYGKAWEFRVRRRFSKSKVITIAVQLPPRRRSSRSLEGSGDEMLRMGLKFASRLSLGTGHKHLSVRQITPRCSTYIDVFRSP